MTKLLLNIYLIAILSISCNKGNEKSAIEGDVKIHLLSDFKTSNETSFAIDFETAVIEDEPLLDYADLLSYNSIEYEFTISDNAIEQLKAIKFSVRGLAFGVTANNKLLFTGYFWPSYSSLSCDWLVIDPLLVSPENNNLRMRLGYPGMQEGQNDNRNHPDMISIFSRDNKLAE